MWIHQLVFLWVNIVQELGDIVWTLFMLHALQSPISRVMQSSYLPYVGRDTPQSSSLGPKLESFLKCLKVFIYESQLILGHRVYPLYNHRHKYLNKNCMSIIPSITIHTSVVNAFAFPSISRHIDGHHHPYITYTLINLTTQSRYFNSSA